jgi:hypothetical protein
MYDFTLASFGGLIGLAIFGHFVDYVECCCPTAEIVVSQNLIFNHIGLKLYRNGSGYIAYLMTFLGEILLLSVYLITCSCTYCHKSIAFR